MPRVNPIKLDPSRTGLIRKKFVADMNRRFALLRQDLLTLVDTEDALGMRDRVLGVFNTRWKFQTDEGKAKSFQEWIKSSTITYLTETSKTRWATLITLLTTP